MPQYLLSIYQPTGSGPEDIPPPEVLDPIMEKVEAVNEELRSAGVWVFAAGLHHPETATVVKASEGEVLTTDGPYVEGKEHIGGFSVIEVSDLDAALGWAAKLTEAMTLPIEVRPLQDGSCG